MHQIHYVIMAYRSVVFKSTGLTPNMLMLGRETSLPLDLIYEVPEPLKQKSPNQWPALIVRESMERAHSFVRHYL